MSWRECSRSIGTLVAVCVSVALLCAAPAGAAHRNDVATPRFVDESAASGLEHVNRYGVTDEVPDGGLEFVVGGGVAVLDCDDDGRPDLYLAGGSGPAALYRNESRVGGPLRFTRLADATTDLVQVSGAYPLDIDSDGHTDLAVLRRGENVLLRGLGGCRFERANEGLGLDGGNDWTTAFSATWEPGARLPTLAFGNYKAMDEAGKLTAGCGGQPSLPARPGRHHVRPGDGPGPRLVPALDPLQRLGPLGTSRPAHQQRPRVLRARWTGAALAHERRRATHGVHREGRLGAGQDLGHGHRHPTISMAMATRRST